MNLLRRFADRYYVNKNTKLAGKNDSLRWQLGDLRARVIALQGQLTEALADCSRSRAAIVSLREVHDAENAEVDARHEAQITKLHKEIDALHERLLDATTRLGLRGSTVAEMGAMEARHRAELRRVKDALAASQNLVARYEGRAVL